MKQRYDKAQAYLNNLANTCPDLPFEPTLLPELFASTADNSIMPISHVSSLVERSPGLAARVLRHANSAYYGMQTAVSSLTHAIQILGLNEVRNIILQLGVASAIRKLAVPKEFPFEHLWEHQLLTANLAKAMGQSLPYGHISKEGDSVTPDMLYSAGLLHDLGKTLVAANCPDDWRAIKDLALCENIPFYKAEENYWGIDHSVTGARMTTLWGLPPKLSALVGWHHAPEQAKPEYRLSTKLLAAANQLSCHSLESVLPPSENKLKPTACLLPENVSTLLPPELNRTTFSEKLSACYDMNRIRSLAHTAMGE